MVKHAGIRNLLQKMLNKDTQKRASLSQILEDPWITMNSSEPVKVTEVELYCEGEFGFGNINRLLKMREIG
jgi:serine/threonine protein kinase